MIVVKKTNFYINTLFLLRIFLLSPALFSKPLLVYAQEVNHALTGTPSYELVNDVPYPYDGNYFGYDTDMRILSRLNDDSSVDPAVGRASSYDFIFNADITLAAPAEIGKIEVFYRAVSLPAGGDLKVYVYDGSWNEVASFNTYAMYGNSIGDLPAKRFEATSATPWSNVQGIRVRAQGRHLTEFTGAWLPSTGYIFEIRAWGPAASSTFQDIGLKVATESGVVSIAAEIGTPTSDLRIAKDGVIYGIALVEPGDENDSGVRVETDSGLKALRKL